MRRGEEENSEGAVYSSRGEWARSSRAFVYRESCFPSRSATGARKKKHSRAVDKLEYLPVDILRGAECRGGSMVFSQVNTADGICTRRGGPS